MAARRIMSLVAAKLPRSTIRTEVTWNSFPRSYQCYTRGLQSIPESITESIGVNQVRHESNSSNLSPTSYTRGLQSIPESITGSIGVNQVHHESNSSNLSPTTTNPVSVSEANQSSSSTNHLVNSKLKVSERHDLAMIFTCKVCEARSIKTVCRESYEKGVVIVKCDGCNNMHLISDRLGWFGEPSSVEEFLAARGEEVKKGSLDTFNLTLEDLAGKKDL